MCIVKVTDRVLANCKAKVTGRCEGKATYPECLPLKQKPPFSGNVVDVFLASVVPQEMMGAQS